MYTLRQAGTRKIPNRLYSGRFTAYILFILLMLFKLAFMHYGLQVRNIDMSPVDYIIAVGSLLLVSFWTLWLSPRGRLAALTLLDLGLTGLIYADLVFYRYFEDFITIPVLLQATQVGSLGESIRSLMHWQDLFFFIDWLVVVPWTASQVIRKRRRSFAYPEVITHSGPKRKSAFKRFSTGFAAFVLGCLLTFAPIKMASNTWAAGLFAGNWWNLSLYNVTGLIGFHGYDVYRYARDHLGMRTALAPEEIDKTKAWLDEKRSKRTVRDEMFGKYKGSNVIVIQVEALMNFVVNKSVNGQEITPNFNRLLKESMYFSNFYHQTALGRTSDADFVTQSSLLPLPAGSVFTRYPTHEYDTLPAVLKEHGYAANVFHSYESSFWNRHIVYREMNYDRFYSKNDYEQDEMIGWSISDASFFKQSLDKMKDIPQPFYSFLITLSSHHPYVMPKREQQLDTGSFQDTMFGDYLQSVHYVDKALGQFVDQMKAQGLWEHSILVIYGDHDNSIKETAYYEQFLGRPVTALDMEQIMNQVPLLIHLPDGALAGIDSNPSGMMDTAPTLYHLLGISSETYDLMGQILTVNKDRLVPLRSGAFSDNRSFYIPSETGTFESGTCYSLSTREPIGVNACRKGYEESQTMLRISDQIITYDLLKTFDSTDHSK